MRSALIASALLGTASLLRAQDLSPSDWSSIRAAWEAGRHGVFAVEGGHRARNPGQRWATEFDGRGFTTTPDAPGWTWGLQLQGYGWGAIEATTGAPDVTAEGQRVSYDWDERLTEWYVNDVSGLEHGYTVRSRPAGATGELVLSLAVRGDLRPVVEGRDVHFVDERGVAVVDYLGLTVTDADGQVLTAGFTAEPGGLRLRVCDAQARYPLGIDPTAQQAFLKGSNTEASDNFGANVAISGDTVVISAPQERSAATGVNGDQSNNSALDSGAAYVFVRNGTSWTQQAYLKASNTQSEVFFGTWLAISGDTIVVSAPYEHSNATGVNGDQSNKNAPFSGAAYVFVRVGTTWSQQAYLKASNTGANDIFGRCTIDADTIVIAAPGEDSNATGIDGNQADNSANAAGAVYVFVRAGTTWSQQAYIKASNAEQSDSFGASVSLSGETLAVGASLEASNATGVNGDQTDNSLTFAGAAYVFVRQGTTWSQQAYLKPPDIDSDDGFGSVAVWGDTVVVGSAGEDSGATGVNGNFADESVTDAGAAYVFVRNGTTWSQQAYLKASNTDANDRFGSVAIWGDTIVVGAANEASSATGVNGDQSNNSAPFSGAAYVFVRSGSTWSQQAYLKASNTGAADNFGSPVAIANGTVIVGARYEGGPNNSTLNAGAAYIFELDLPWTDLGFAKPGSNGTPKLSGLGPLTAASPNQIDLVSAPPSTMATLIVGFSQLGAPFKGGVLVPNPQLLITLTTSPSGTLKLPFTWPSNVPAGLPLYLQFWISDPGASHGLSASNGLTGVSG